MTLDGWLRMQEGNSDYIKWQILINTYKQQQQKDVVRIYNRILLSH